MRTQQLALVAIIAVIAVTGSLLLASRANRGTGESQNPTVSQTSAKASSQANVVPIQVKVTKITPQPGRVEYHYTVTNGGTFAVHMLAIGDDRQFRVPRLAGEPIGWNGDTIPSTSYQAPPGWKFLVQPMEEESLLVVRWEKTEHGRAIMGGESVAGFMVALAQPDSNYDYPDGVWEAYLLGEAPVSGQILPSGAPAP